MELLLGDLELVDIRGPEMNSEHPTSIRKYMRKPQLE